MTWQKYHRKLLALSETGETLNASQRSVSRLIQQEIDDYEQRINVYGNAGVGKTFLAHYLHHQAEVLYFPSFIHCQNEGTYRNCILMIDSAPQDRQQSRHIFGELLWAEADSVILITRKPINDAIKRIELPLTDQDKEQFQTTVSKLFGKFPLEKVNDFDLQRSGFWIYIKALSVEK